MRKFVLPKVIPPSIRNGGKHPASSNIGNKIFPNMAPIRPKIIVIELTIVLINKENHYFFAFYYKYFYVTLKM